MSEAPLTEYEIEVLELLCRHMTGKEIAEELYISENTVKYHKANTLAKTWYIQIYTEPSAPSGVHIR